MRLGLMVTDYTFGDRSLAILDGLTNAASGAEAAGLQSLWVTDHFFQAEWPGSGRSARDPMLEAWSVLAFAAATTRRLRLGTMVSPVMARHPGILAKTATTLDVLSGGRAVLGLGTGWYEREHAGLGIPFPSQQERFDRLEETLRIIRQMWSNDDGAFSGTFYRLAETLDSPSPVQRPGPPIVVGGGGERRTLRLVAKYADACNLYPTPELAHKLDVLRRHCEDVGRDFATIERTVQFGGRVSLDGSRGRPTLGAFVKTLAGLAGQGIDEAVLIVPAAEMAETIEMLGEWIVPAARDLPVAGR